MYTKTRHLNSEIKKRVSAKDLSPITEKVLTTKVALKNLHKLDGKC